MEVVEKGTNVAPQDLGLPSIFNTPNNKAFGFGSSANLAGEGSTTNFKLRLESQFTPIGSSGATPQD